MAYNNVMPGFMLWFMQIDIDKGPQNISTEQLQFLNEHYPTSVYYEEIEKELKKRGQSSKG